ncbi:serine/threonine-protein kinase LMTK1 isoform X2 [Hemibagrus wyckioides]|uniref:serine/threonine-protein kinase LMTK1 isoform X2 n=1 Tax=Hemibagrus wyckioides TaxID=337641 RepID=UPI00266D887C|nr:serine/threonine-protein kinase LMTK1 isoform X2 [Hemibagrus wyckioides]
MRMPSSLFIVIMSSIFLNPSFAFSSHYDTGGAPLSELSWPSSLAVVAVSFSGLFTFIFLMLACLCCKKGDISFKEFENTGEEYQADLSTLASSGSQDGPDVYVLPLTEVSLPVAKQPCRSIQLLKSADLGRHSLLYLKEIGHDWFGKVFLGEVNAGLSTTQVVVKELKASASIQEQTQFLEEALPYRTLQHPAILQCLAQCTDVTPYLLIMEYCPLGDVKGYLRSCRAAGSATPDPFILQQMACEIASGLQYLHKHNYIHSDLALRNCLLTSEMSVKIGDYGLSHSRYKDDYFVTADQIWVPLRWIAPELIDEVHGNLLVVDQTKASNVWSLGVTIWELFELGSQPYRHYTDRQVLTYAVKEQQLKLPKPLLKVPLSERWYEVMQFCWLQPEQRPVVEEVYLLLNYLCAKGTGEAEEDFEKRWNSLRPSLDSGSAQRTPALEVPSSNSSFPLLEHFSMVDSFQSESGDEILTVTETSDGLNFEYKWEQARSEQPYCSSSTSGPLGSSNPHYQDIYYPLSSSTGSCKGESLNLGVSPSQYKSDYPGVVPVLSAHSPSVSSEYYIRIEEPVECNISVEEATLDYSPELEASKCTFSMTEMKSPTEAHANTYWPGAKVSNSIINDSDASPSAALSVEPPQRQDMNHMDSAEQLSQYFSPSDRDRLHCELALSGEQEVTLKRVQISESCLKSGSLHNTGVQETPRGISVSLSSPSLGQCDPYLEANQRTVEKNIANEAYYDMMGSLPKNIPRPHNITVDVESADCLLMSAADPEDDISHFTESETINWTSNHSTNNNTLNFDDRQTRGFIDTYIDVHHTTPSSSAQSLQPGTITTRQNSPSYHSDAFKQHMEVTGINSSAFSYSDSYTECVSYIQLCSEDQKMVESSSPEKLQIIHPAQNTPHLYIRENMTYFPIRDYSNSHPFSLLTEKSVTKDRSTTPAKDIKVQSAGPTIMPAALSECVSECCHTGDSISLVNIDDCSDGDVTEITSEVFADSPSDFAKVGDINLAHIPLQREIQNQDPQEFIELASSSSPCEAFSPDAYHTSILPKSLDSGYDTENNESPEFVMKDLEGKPVLSTSVESEYEMVLQMDLEENDLTPTSNSTLNLTSLGNRNQYRDSAYFSDYDAENEKSPCEGGSIFFDNKLDDFFGKEPVKDGSLKKAGRDGGFPVSQKEDQYNFPSMTENVDNALLSVKQLCVERKNMEFDLSSSPASGPVITLLAPFPPEMGGCLTKESAPDDGLGVESEHSGEEPASECFSSTASEGSSSTQEASTMEDQVNSTSMGFSSADSLGSESTILDVKDCENGEDNTDCQMDGENEENKGVEEQAELVEEALLNVKRDSSLDNILPALPENLDIPAPLGNCEEDSDDSDESDEELRSYNVQEQSEESEEEFTTVPMVVMSERSSTRHLRSLLKMPSLLTQSFCDELERKKKAVSFFDDVTVFLFDQDSPTGELAEYTFPPGMEANGQAAECKDHPSTKEVSDSDNVVQDNPLDKQVGP